MNDEKRLPEGVSHSVDLDKVVEISKTNPKNAILMLVAYLKLRDGHYIRRQI